MFHMYVELLKPTDQNIFWNTLYRELPFWGLKQSSKQAASNLSPLICNLLEYPHAYWIKPPIPSWQLYPIFSFLVVSVINTGHWGQPLEIIRAIQIGIS